MDKQIENKIRKEIRRILLEVVEMETCVKCGGEGFIDGEICPRCGGEGELPKNVEDIFHQIGGETEIDEKIERGKLRSKKVKPLMKPKKPIKVLKKIKPIKPPKPMQPKLYTQKV